MRDVGADTGDEGGRGGGPPLDLSGECPNCGQAPVGRYCPRCGQNQRPDRTVRALAADILDGVFDLDSRLWRTLRVLLTRPGRLSVEHRAGRRARYLPPVRLYLLSSVVFFTMIELTPSRIVTISVGDPDTAAEASADADAAPPVGAQDPEEPVATLEARIRTAAVRAANEPERLDQLFIRSLAWTMFLLIPVFALLLGLLFRKGTILYVQHLVFALHYHAFAFLTQALGFAAIHLRMGGATGDAVSVLTPQAVNAVYLVAATRRFYGRGWALTVGKVAALGFAYLLAVSVGIVLTLLGVVLFVWSG